MDHIGMNTLDINDQSIAAMDSVGACPACTDVLKRSALPILTGV